MDVRLLLRSGPSLALVCSALSMGDDTRVAVMADGWGGRRTGAGAKPRPKAPVSPFKTFTVPEPPSQAENDLLTPPADLSQVQQEFWTKYAPIAVERKTLTVATEASFRLLCELHAKKTMVGEMVDKGALGGLRVFMQLSKQIEGLMGRFCLAPFGKPVVSEKPKQAVNPFAQVIGQ